jgi:BirA family biotin operon repressor/biotin-[acetyl-CoA-carboxylase] ligase
MTSDLSDRIDPKRLLAAGRVAGVEYHETIGSTHDRAHEIARSADGGPLPLVVVADEQTAGRGRGTNQWWTGRGSLAFSLLFDPADWDIVSRPVPERSLAVGAAIVDSVAPLLSGHTVGLHWPNDVFAGGKKLAGILIDVLPGGRHVVGIGINVNNSIVAAPEELRGRATSLIDLTGRPSDRTELLAAVLANIEDAVRRSAADAEAFGRRFHELCLQVGHELTIEVGGRRSRGRCAGIGTDGALILETTDGRQKFYSGVLR